MEEAPLFPGESIKAIGKFNAYTLLIEIHKMTVSLWAPVVYVLKISQSDLIRGQMDEVYSFLLTSL